MSKSPKIAAYAALALGAFWFGYGFYARYATVVEAPTDDPATNSAAARPDAAPPQRAGTFHAQRASTLLIYGVGAVAVLIALGLLAAHDLTHFFANRVEDFIFDDEGEPMPSPEYDHAEEVWKSGEPLEAIQLMRDYLAEHPRKQFVALRIAEIYEKDLSNHVAAALEYEEILKKRLPPERWGWAAVHLANLYSGKLGKVTEAETLLRRIVNEYGQTAAAKKARQRLGLPEPVVESAPPEPEKTAEPSEPAKPPPPASNLPPGFRPRSN